jgi:hypothetical protein
VTCEIPAGHHVQFGAGPAIRLNVSDVRRGGTGLAGIRPPGDRARGHGQAGDREQDDGGGG